jgi:hypothetical protein
MNRSRVDIGFHCLLLAREERKRKVCLARKKKRRNLQNYKLDTTGHNSPYCGYQSNPDDCILLPISTVCFMSDFDTIFFGLTKRYLGMHSLCQDYVLIKLILYTI